MKKFSLTPPQKIMEGVCAAVLLGMVLGPILFWGRLPDLIPGHYNGAGEIDRWTGKWELLLMPVFGALMYLFLSFCCWLIGESVRKGELPRPAYTWKSAKKLDLIATFAALEGSMAAARPVGAWLLPADAVLLAALMAGFLISSLRFAGRRGKK